MNPTKRQKVVVLGAGITGLASAYRLSNDERFEVHVVEKEAIPGGVCRSFSEGDFILDHGPHKFYTLLDGILDELHDLMGEELIEQEKRQSLYMCGKYFDFPLRMTEMLLKFPPLKSAKVLSSYAAQVVKNQVHKKESITYEDFITERFGRGLYEQIFAPMASKIYGNPSELDRKLAEVRISSPGLTAVIKQLLFSKVDRTISAPTFHYPKEGYGRIPMRLYEKSQSKGATYHLGATIKELVVKDGRVSEVVIEDKNKEIQRLSCDQLVYTIPLSQLGHLISGLPANVKTATQSIGYRNTIIYYYLLKSAPVLPSMWVFFPEPQFRFGRLSEMVKFSPHVAPKGHTALMVDFTCESSDPAWNMDDEALGKMLYEQMEPLKLFAPSQVHKQFSRRFRNFYPIYTVGYEKNVEALRSLETLYNNLYFIGRLGDFNYNNADQCLDMGFAAADHIRKKDGVGQGWQELRRLKFDQYRIVD